MSPEDLTRLPLPAQLAALRRRLGLTQEEVAEQLSLKQTHISRLEKSGSDHRTSLYGRAAGALGARLALIPEDMVLVPKKRDGAERP